MGNLRNLQSLQAFDIFPDLKILLVNETDKQHHPGAREVEILCLCLGQQTGVHLICFPTDFLRLS